MSFIFERGDGELLTIYPDEPNQRFEVTVFGVNGEGLPNYGNVANIYYVGQESLAGVINKFFGQGYKLVEVQ